MLLKLILSTSTFQCGSKKIINNICLLLNFYYRALPWRLAPGVKIDTREKEQDLELTGNGDLGPQKSCDIHRTTKEIKEKLHTSLEKHSKN